ncbi:MAG: hypothetical protein JNK09_19120 [Prolixibacteraceae bacterium]|nr:hypothetical protein [Prolixibacteraceae bacterium]
MTKPNTLSRRNFMKSTALASSAILGATAISACTESGKPVKKLSDFPTNALKNYQPSDGVSGLLFSQLGYEPGLPVRIVLRLPKKELIQEKSTCLLLDHSGTKKHETAFNYWGEIWKSHWWIAEFAGLEDDSEWNVEVRSGSDCVFSDTGLIVRKNILWESTVEWSSVDMLERRKHFTGVGAGWQDAGTLWVESPAQSAMIISLEELLEKSRDRFDEKFVERIYTQITVGCDYLVMTQNKAEELGFPKGSMSHDLKGHEKDILPHDAMKAVVALAKASNLLLEKFSEKKLKYSEVAKKAFLWLTTSAKPMGDYGYVRMQRGLNANTVIPEDEWLTRDLLTMCAASLEITKLGENSAMEKAIEFARKVMARQIPKEKAESSFYGHFQEFASMSHSEPSWVHGIVPGSKGAEFGADMGGIYPNYLMPFIEMLKLWPGHADAPKWRETLKSFAYNYLIPACERNPFLLVPQGIFGNEGPIWFCGTFHGTNAIYGYTAALSLELAHMFNDSKLIEIAYSNLQWLAGLNAGITKDNLKQGCVIFSADLPEGAALPASMICHIGKRWAGTWFQTRGVICNGFSTGEQFKYDTEPKQLNDGPFSLTDEDWIPHSAAWLAGLIRLQKS